MRRILFILLIVLIVSVVLAAAAWCWGVPAMARARMAEELSKYWAGPVEVGRVEVSLDSQVRLSALSLSDEQGRTWLAAEGMSLDVAGLAGSEPALRRARVEELVLTAHVEDGTIRPPVLPGPPELTPREGLANLELAAVRTLRLRVVGEDGATLIDQAFRLDLRRADDAHVLEVRGGEGRSEARAFLVGGDQPIVKARLLRRGGAASLEGAVAAGELHVRVPGELILRNARAGFVLTREGLTLDRLAVRVGPGELKGRAKIELGPAGEGLIAGYEGRIEGSNLDVPALAAAVAPKVKMQSGVGAGWVEFHGRGAALGRLRGRGAAAGGKVDLAGVPWVRRIMSFLRLGSVGPFDVTSAFDLRGPVVYVREADLAAPLFAGVVEKDPPAYLDLSGSYLRASVVYAPFRSLRNVPFLGRLAGAATAILRNATRVEIEGNWRTDSPRKLVRKRPLNDAARGLIETLTPAGP